MFYLVLSILLGMSVTEAKMLTFTGVATGKNDKVVYTEAHEALFDGDKVLSSETKYFELNPVTNVKTQIAELKSDYRKSLYLPDYTFKDYRNGMEHIVVMNEGKLLVKARKNKDKPVEEKTFEPKSNMISGQGFHYFIREHIESFTKSENQDVKFLMPGLLDYFSFNISPNRQPASEDPDHVLHLKMAVNSIFLKVFVSTITMTYDKVKRTLLSYNGISNLETMDGKTQDVRIVYSY